MGVNLLRQGLAIAIVACGVVACVACLAGARHQPLNRASVQVIAIGTITVIAGLVALASCVTSALFLWWSTR